MAHDVRRYTGAEERILRLRCASLRMTWENGFFAMLRMTGTDGFLGFAALRSE